VPITPIPRDQINFNHWFCDILGPLFPNQRVDYNYCFVCCDSNTRFPFCFPLREVTAKNVCDCLLKLWMTFGVSQFVSLDNGSCNTDELTRMLMEKLGCSPIFITPTHSQGN
jgi:Integrase core domain